MRIPKRLVTLPVVIAALAAVFARAQNRATIQRTADKIVIRKSLRKMTLFSGGKELKSYKISLGGEPSGAKQRQGDHRTPEGTYFISGRNAKSKFHRSLRIS